MDDYLTNVELDESLVLPVEIVFESNVLSNESQVQEIKKRLQNLGFSEIHAGHDTRMIRKPQIKSWLSNEIAMSAVILNWKRLANLKTIVRQLRRRSFITEILIWNNNPIEIDFKDMGLDQNYDWLTIINSKENLKDEAKYLAASKAKNKHIFYQDDDWSTAHYIDAMYGAYCMNPTHLHVATGELTWAENQFFSFYNQTLGLQSEFCFIGCGSMFPKSFAEKHLNLINEFFENSEKAYADLGFSLLLNQPIVKIQVGLCAFSNENAFSSESDFLEEASNLKQKIVASLLRFSQRKKALPRCMPRSAFKNLILFTSYLPEGLDQSEKIFDPQNPEHKNARLRYKPSNGASSIFRKHPYFNAIAEVPGQKECFWLTKIDVNDQWGIWLLKPMRIQLNIKEIEGSNLTSCWHVKVDDRVEVMSLKQMMEFDRMVSTELLVSCVNISVVLGIKIHFTEKI